jgi:small subunit ribosomal protein S6
LQTYETLFITPPNLTEEDERTIADALAGVVTDGGGTLVTQDRMGRRRLGYPIQKFDDGVYIRLLYDSDPAVPKELERRGRLSDHVLRMLTVRLEEEWAEDAKQQAVRDAERRAEAEAQAKIEAEKAAAEAEEAAKRAAEESATAPEPASSTDASPAAVASAAVATEAAADTEGDDEEKPAAPTPETTPEADPADAEKA